VEEAASSSAEQLRMRLEPGVARQRQRQRHRQQQRRRDRHPAAEGSGTPRSPPTAGSKGGAGLQRAGRGGGRSPPFAAACEMSGDAPAPGPDEQHGRS